MGLTRKGIMRRITPNQSIEFLDRLETGINTMSANSSFTEQDMEKLRKSVDNEFSPIVISS